MPLLSLYDYKTMPYPERCQRIGELLGKAVVGLLREQRIAALDRSPGVPHRVAEIDLAEMVSDKTERQIIRHLMLAGEASPQDFCAVLHISPATSFRKLARLRTAGLVTVEGKTQAARYRLRGGGHEN
ncbi:MAG: hypothetical protein WC378_13425 [Opitutaceae bacterium]|jgi:DNA-binding transcriptional ArsR family regulator